MAISAFNRWGSGQGMVVGRIDVLSSEVVGIVTDIGGPGRSYQAYTWYILRA